MTALAAAPYRRGACPGLSAPMPTGDGLLVRLLPTGTISLSAFAALCTAARRHGNGVVEVTSRGSIQVRGLNDRSAPHFAEDIATLDIAAEDGVPIHCNALAGIDAEEIFDSETLTTDLRRVLSQRSLATTLSPKVSVAIDGGGALGLANLSADVRLCARKTNGAVALRVGVGGDGESAADLGTIDPTHGVEAIVRLLDVIARCGNAARARDILASNRAAEFHAALFSCPSLCRANGGATPGKTSDAIGVHRLKDGSLACGIGLAFGHSDAAMLEQLVETAQAAGVSGFRAALGRALLAIGLSPAKTPAFAGAAEKLGFITRAGDPRQRVIACAGAPICASAHIASRALAPLIAAQTQSTVHISGCAKGCAHAAPAALTVVGTDNGCALVANGTARDAPFAIVPESELPAAIARFTYLETQEAEHV